MALVTSVRVLLAAALAVLAAAVYVAAGSGSPPAPLRATAPRLLAHDRSHFVHVRDAHGLPRRRTPSRRRLSSASFARTFSGLSGSTTYSNVTGDVGKTQYVQAAGGSYAIYSRVGTTLASLSDKTFWSGLSGGPDSAGLCATSPQSSQMVAYDRAGDRWVIAELAYAVDANSKPTGPLDVCIAVSASGDATSVWYRYVFQVSTTLYADFPSLGVWGDGYYLSFDEETSAGSFLGAGALAVERSKMMTGASAQARYFDLQNVTPRLGGMQPANNESLTTPSGSEPYVQAHDDPTNINDRLEVWGFHVDWTAPITGSTFAPVSNVPVSSYSSTFSCAKPGTSTTWTTCIRQATSTNTFIGQELEPLSQAYSDSTDALPRLGGHVEYQSSGGVEELTTAFTTNGGGEWLQLLNNGSGWSLHAQVPNAGDFFPSAATDGSGNAATAYELSEAGSYDPSFAVQDPNDNSGTVVALTGATDHSGDSAWGRSTTITLDPVDLCTLWASGPATRTAASWASQIVGFTVSGCTEAVTQPPLLTRDPSWTAPLVREGLSITGTTSTWTTPVTNPVTPIAVTHQWRRCDVNGLNCIDIGGATGTTYTMTAADAAGYYTLRFQDTATTTEGTSVAVSQPTTLVQSIPPVNTALPTISGIDQEGSTLTADPGSWVSSSAKSYTYRWRRCASGVCSNISGATASTYTLTTADVGSTIDVVVSATNTGGGTDANAAATTAIQPLTPPANVALPTLTGTLQEGSQVSASTGTWTSMTPITYAYSWARCDLNGTCATITGATGATYTVATADVGMDLVATVTATNNGGSSSASSDPSVAVVSVPPTNQTLPALSTTTLQSGNTLTTTNGTWTSSSPLTYSYAWQRCTNGTCSAIPLATANSYTMQPADVGSTIAVVVGATNTGGTTFAAAPATATAVVAAPPVNAQQPAVFGTTQVGSILNTTNGTWTSAFPVTFAYQWKRCGSGVCTDISGANGSSYTLVSADAGLSVEAVVTATSIGGSTAATSPQSTIVQAAPASGGGGGGGGGGGTPDLTLTGVANPTSPLPGDTVALAYAVVDKNLAPATKLILTVTLPAGLTYVSSTVDRGSGCASAVATQVVCNLDYLSSDSPKANVYIYAKETASGAQTVVATATSDLGDLSSSDNTFSVTLNAATTSASGVPTGLNGSGSTTTKKTDKKAPSVAALSSTGRRGQTAKLRLKVYDDSGQAQVSAVVRRNGKLVGRAKTGFGPVAYGSVYFVGWHVPRAAPKGRYTFCVAAADHANNHSTASCAPLTLR